MHPQSCKSSSFTLPGFAAAADVIKHKTKSFKRQMSWGCLKATSKNNSTERLSLSVRFVDSSQCQSFTNWGTASITWWPVLVKAVHPGKEFGGLFGRVPLPIN